MTTQVTSYFLHALAPMHIGTGVGSGAIDLPVSREVATRLPNAPGSGVKGVVKDLLRGGYGDPDNANEYVHALGADPQPQAQTRAQSALAFSDAMLLAFPVRSLCGVFAWVTSPYEIHRLRRIVPTCPSAPAVATGHAATGASARLSAADKALYLHDLKLIVDGQGATQDAANQIADHLASLVFPGQAADKAVNAERLNFTQRFVIVSDEDLVHLSNVGCEVRMRNALEAESKTVKDGQLWSEEYVPGETIFFGTLMADHIGATTGQQALSRFCEIFGPERVAQFGGKATIGKGVARMVITPVLRDRAEAAA